MSTLDEGQYELDGYLFGLGTSVRVLGAGDITDQVAVRNQDVDHPRADMKLMGRDQLTAPGRTFTWLVEDTDAATRFAELRQAWRADDVRSIPGRLSVLRWMRHGVTYWSQGRARDFETLHRDPVMATRRYASAKWQYAEAQAYLDRLDSLELSLIGSAAPTGFTLPAVLPWILGSVTSQRQGVVTVDGLADVPFRAVIAGPSTGQASNLRLSGPGWLLDFGALVLQSGSQIVVDTSSIGSALMDGASVAGALSRKSTLTGRLQPGTAEFAFTATDSSRTTRATISWRPSALIF